MTIKDSLVGITFGYREVLEEVQSKNGQRRYKCRCLLCNKIDVVYALSLKAGKAIMCKRCSNRRGLENITGKSFGNYEVLEEVTERIEGDKRRIYKCRCTICGSIHNVSAGSLVSGVSTKCKSCASKLSRDDKAIAMMVGASISTKIPALNTSGIRGVHFDNSSGKWRASISIHGKPTSLGRFSTKEEAAFERERAQAQKIEQLKAEGIIKEEN